MRRWIVIVALFALVSGGVLAAFVYTLPRTRPRPAPFPHSSPPAPPPFAPSEGSEREHRRLEVVDLVAMFPDRVVRMGPRDRREVALTFDDAPDGTFTPRILDVLKEAEAPATFFVNGVLAERHPDVMARIAAEGHAVASHGYGHIRYSAVPPETVRADLRRNAAVIHQLTGTTTDLFRPPYGALDALAARIVLDEGYLIVLWTVDTRDWLGRGAEEIERAALEGAGPGTIVLQHASAGGTDITGTVEALPRIIRGLRARGLRLVTVPDLLDR